MPPLDTEYIKTTALIRASEQWSDEYAKDPVSHARLMKLEAKWQLILNRYFKEIAANAANLISPGAYSALKADYNIDVIVNDDALDQGDGTFISVSLEVVTELVATGAQAGETIYDIPLSISSTSANIQRLGTDQVASLVGKKVMPDGSIVDNPRPKYNITQTMRNDIAQSIKTSLALGEKTQEAIDRLQKVISDPKRAERIVRTESVNAYQAGLSEFARASGAVGKQSLDVGAVDRCAEYSAMGPVPIGYLYDSVYDGPTYHVGCRCGRRLIYPAEWKTLGLSL